MNIGDMPAWFLKMMRKVAPSLFYRGVYEYRVTKSTSGRIDVEPTDPDEELDAFPLAEIWPGIGGYSADPVVGTTVLVAFVKGDTSKPRVVGFCPLSYTKPTANTIDATSIKIGGANYKQAARKGDTSGYLLFDPGALTLYVCRDPATGVWIPVATNPNSPSPPPNNVFIGTPIVITEGSSKTGIE